MNFDPKDMEVKTLFKTYDCFKIPVFQRDYSWDRPYYSKFLLDIISRLKFEKEKIITTPYFIGTMVFIGEKNGGTVDVVDGQQRITVITILLSALSKLFKDNGDKTLSETTFKYVKEMDDDGNYKTHMKSDTSYPYFECFIQSEDKKYKGIPSNEEEENIKATYDFFMKELSENKLMKVFGNNIKYSDALKAIRDQVLSSLVICIRTPDKTSAYMIFEILNAKGKNLASIDLIKNVIFEKMHNDPDGASARADDLWNSIKSKLRERDNSIGLVTFYRHFWISKYKKVTNTKLYDSFKDLIKPKTVTNYIDFLQDLNYEADIYIKILSPLISDYDNRKEYVWLVQSLNTINNTFNNVQSRIALLALLDAKKRDVISTKKLKGAILFIENFIFEYIIVASQRANIFEPRFSKLALSIRSSDSKSKTNEIIDTQLFEALKSNHINYDVFEENFIKFQYQKKNHSMNIISKYILNKLSSYYDEKDIFNDDSSIEHILPESDDITFNIGNLICLEEKLNREAEDLSFDEKLEIYEKSKYKEIEKFIDKYDTFNEDDINKRAKELSKFYFEKILGRKIM